MYAIIKTGGKQYCVEEGKVITIEKLDVEAGAEVAFDEVLLVSGSSGFSSTSATSSGYNLAFLSRYSVTGISFATP